MKQARLISIGDRFPAGKISEIHSRFERVVNFVCGELVVSLTDSSLPAGSFRAVLDTDILPAIDSLEYQSGWLILNDNMQIKILPEHVYNSGISLGDKDYASLQTDILVLRKMYLAQERKSLLAELLTGAETKPESEFERRLLADFRNAYDLFLQGEYELAIRGFKGRGMGLTPAGDDFNAGLLLGLFVREQTEKKELSKIRSCIYTNSIGANLLINTFLLQAKQGWFNADFKALLTALVSQSDNLEAALDRVLAQGATSGADMLAGFLAAWDIKI
jgi:hypothetical protein